MQPRSADPTAGQVVLRLARHPWDGLLRRWNWKSAVSSAVTRGLLFFAANVSAGWPAATSALATELVLRACTSGFYGAITQAFVPVRPAWTATLTTMVLLPVLSHTLEFAVHAARGTPELSRSVAASIAFTALSTSFNLFVMRHGALLVGEGRASVADDLRRMPRLVAAFVLSACRAVGGLRRHRRIL